MTAFFRFFVLIALSTLALAGQAFARGSDDEGEQCAHNLERLLSDKTIFGVAQWGETWVEYHSPDGEVILSNIDLSDARAGTWSNESCMVICYSYPNGNGWCPEWREVDGGWQNVRPGTDEIVHQIYLIQDGDVMNLAGALDRADASAGRI